MQVASLAELRQALLTASPGDTIELAPGEYRGPLVVNIPVTLRGMDRKTVVWRRGGPVISVQVPGVKLEKLLLERTVDTQGPLVVHKPKCNPDFAPGGRESRPLDALINLGELVPGSTLTLPLELEIVAPTEVTVTGLYGAQVSPTSLEEPGSHIVWLTLDGNAVQRGELLLGELLLREGDSQRYIWLSGTVLDTPLQEQHYCLAYKKTRLYPSPRGLMLDSTQLALLDGGEYAGRYGFIQRDPTGTLFFYQPGEAQLPVTVNGVSAARWTRQLLKEKDVIKIGGLSLSIQRTEPPAVTIDPPIITFGDFDEAFPDPVTLTVQNGKTAWKGRLISATPWLDILPDGDFRIPPSRSSEWTVQLNSAALELPNGLHETIGGILVVGPNQSIAVDSRLRIQRPAAALRIERLDAGTLEWGWPVDRSVELAIGNLGHSIWTGGVRSGVSWLQVSTPMPMSCGPWSEATVQFQITPSWDNLPVGTYELPRAIVVDGPNGEQVVGARLEVVPARGHISPLAEQISFDQVERDAPLPTLMLEVRNDGGAPWLGTLRSANGWVRLRPDSFTEEAPLLPGTVAEVEVHLQDVPPDLALDTPDMLDQIRLENEDSVVTLAVQITVVELPPFLVAHTVNFPPFVRGDNPPEGLLRIHNNGPARWRGTVTAHTPGLNVADSVFVCEAGSSIEFHITLTSAALAGLQTGITVLDHALSVNGGREPVEAAVQIDLRDPISELHLETPLLNFGQVDSSTSLSELPSQAVRLVNAGPAATSAQVQLRVPWLSVPGSARSFTLELPGATIAEFPLSVNDTARQLPTGVTAEERAIVITHAAQTIEIAALVLVNEALPALTIAPDHLTLVGDMTQSISVRNIGKRRATFQVIAVEWLSVAPAELVLEPEQVGSLEVKRTARAASGLSDPRAIVLAASGREFEIEVQSTEPPPGPIAPETPITPPASPQRL